MCTGFKFSEHHHIFNGSNVSNFTQLRSNIVAMQITERIRIWYLIYLSRNINIKLTLIMAKSNKVSSKLVLLQGIRRLAMPSRSFSETTMNVSFGYYWLNTEENM